MSSHAAERGQALELLRRALNAPGADFREGQWEAIEALVNRRARLLVVERTGWGKSSVYFIATRILRDRGQGPTLIVSPLLALMRNQQAAAARLEIRALSINSTNRHDWPELSREILAGQADALLISPERLANDEFVQSVLLPVAQRIGLLVVDEVHCISDWGHDFRPDYRRLVSVVQRMPRNMPILGTTATANDRVVADVRDQLGDMGVQRGPLIRDTLALQTVRLRDQSARLAWLAEHVPSLPGTGIIYALTKRDADQVAGWLSSKRIDARAYYSDVEDEGFESSDAYRQHLEDMLLRNQVKALVATPALGMGFDKPDLGFVIHYQAPGSVVAYYQQVGRAGRAIPSAYGVLLAGDEDLEISDYFIRTAFPTREEVAEVIQALEAAPSGLSVPELMAHVNVRKTRIEKVLDLLRLESPSPIAKQETKWQLTAAPVSETFWERAERLTTLRHFEQQQMQEYVDLQSGHMDFLIRALDGTPSAAAPAQLALLPTTSTPGLI